MRHGLLLSRSATIDRFRQALPPAARPAETPGAL